MAKGKGKGSAFERKICKVLSEWWTNGERDDIYWRTAASGAMAKIRSKSKKGTFGQGGDIQAIDPIGQPLIDLCSIELKKGYSAHSFMDVVDRGDHLKNACMYESFILQAQIDAKNAGIPYWLLIVERNQRKAMIFVPLALYKKLKDKCPKIANVWPRAYVSCELKEGGKQQIFFTTLDEFLLVIKPKHIKQMRP